jgi:D-beta-D-heptose 7-phosphate kinase/D-beta-D-heptose 1-phosphate adenosyltransferase
VCRISPEALAPVVRVIHQSAQPGGAANVAMNLAKLGAGVTVVGFTGADNGRLLAAVMIKLPKCHGVVLSDYAKGVLDPKLCQEVIVEARRRRLSVMVDPKTADFSRYRGRLRFVQICRIFRWPRGWMFTISKQY